MTGKEIAAKYVSDRLWGWSPSKEELESVADKKLTDKQYEAAKDQLTKIIDRTRKPLVRYLSGRGMSGI